MADVQHNPAPCKRFLNLVLNAEIIAAGLKFFGMSSVNDKPTKISSDEKMKDHIKPVKQRYLHGVIKKFICTYIVDAQMYVKHFGNVDSLQEWEAYQQAQSVNEELKMADILADSKVVKHRLNMMDGAGDNMSLATTHFLKFEKLLN